MQLFPTEMKGKIYDVIKYDLQFNCIIFVINFVDYVLCFINSDIASVINVVFTII